MVIAAHNKILTSECSKNYNTVMTVHNKILTSYCSENYNAVNTASDKILTSYCSKHCLLRFVDELIETRVTSATRIVI